VVESLHEECASPDFWVLNVSYITDDSRRPVRAPSGSMNSGFFRPPTTITRQYISRNPSLCSYSTSSHLTHIDERGRPSMVDVGDKLPTKRTATASGRIFIPKIAHELIMSSYPSEEAAQNPTQEGKTIVKVRRKGDVLTVAQLAAIMGAKQTSSLIPLCHPLALSKIDVSLRTDMPLSRSHDNDKENRHSILCTATVSCDGKTGVEMEALTAVSVGLLTVWDMLKAVAGKEMEIGEIMVTHKSGGRSGDFDRSNN